VRAILRELQPGQDRIRESVAFAASATFSASLLRSFSLGRSQKDLKRPDISEEDLEDSEVEQELEQELKIRIARETSPDHHVYSGKRSEAFFKLIGDERVE
jgi:hypothetical protein